MPRGKKKPAAEGDVIDQAEMDKAHETRAKGKKKQAELAGFERVSDPDLDKLAIELTEMTAQAGSLRNSIGQLKLRIEQAMTDRKMTRYRFVDGETAKDLVLKAGERELKVVTVKQVEDGDGGDE